MNDKRSALLIVLCLFFATSCIEEEVYCVIESTPYVYDAIVETNTNHIAFPTIAGYPDGSKLIIAYREGSGHTSFDGKIIQKESYDQGVTWGNRKVIYDGGAGCDARDPQFVTLADGTIICRFFVRTSQDASTVKFIRSNDCGKTYDNRVGEFPMPHRGETYAAARGNMLVTADAIYSTSYNRWHENWLMKSVDQGVSWKFVAWIDNPVDLQRDTHFQLNEASLGIHDNRMYVVSRSGFDEPRKIHVARSEDEGCTWNEWKQLPVYGQAPSLTPYKDKHILTYRNTKTDENEHNRFHFDMALFKDGELCSKTVTLLKTHYFDMGYGDVFTFDDFFLLCCYTENSIHCFKILYDVFED